MTRHVWRRSLGAVLLWSVTLTADAGLIPPPLDEADYAFLRSAIQARIPEYAPGWTDYNTHDPGITLLGLFAFAVTDLGSRVAVELPDLVWLEYDAYAAETMDGLAYTLLAAAYLARSPDSPRPADWLMLEGVDPAWSVAELRAAAIRAVPVPPTAALLAAGLLVSIWRWHRMRRFGHFRWARQGSGEGNWHPGWANPRDQSSGARFVQRRVDR